MKIKKENLSLGFNPEVGIFDNFSLPDWNYDGSSTGQAEGYDSEVVLKPQRVYKNPFLTDRNAYLVLCETYFNFFIFNTLYRRYF